MNRELDLEQGSALIVVLAVIAVLAVMAAQLAVSTRIAAREADALATRTSLRYRAESAAERGFWMLLTDHRQFRLRQLGVLQPPDMMEQERWQADGSKHRFVHDDYTVEMILLDANRGFDISGPYPGEYLRSFLLRGTDSLDQYETINRFLDVLHDYVDDGEKVTRRLHGKRQDDYRAEGWPDLPRMGPMMEKEEILWIDGIEDIMALPDLPVTVGDFVETIRLIPPEGRSFPDLDKPSFFSSSPLLIRQLAALSELEWQALEQAREDWQQHGGNFFTYLDPGLAARLRQHFMFSESGVATVVVKAAASDNLINRQIIITRPLSHFMQPRGTAQVIENWHKVLR